MIRNRFQLNGQFLRMKSIKRIERTNKMVVDHVMECYATLKRNKLPIHTVPWRHLKSICSVKTSHIQKTTTCMTPLIWHSRHRVWELGIDYEGTGRNFGDDGYLTILTVVVCTTVYHFKTNWSVGLKWMHYRVWNYTWTHWLKTKQNHSFIPITIRKMLTLFLRSCTTTACRLLTMTRIFRVTA